MLKKDLRILYVGQLRAGGTSAMRLDAMRRLGHDIAHIDTTQTVTSQPNTTLLARLANRLGYPLDVSGANAKLIETCATQKFDLVWIDSVKIVKPETLCELRKSCPQTTLVSFIMDDPFATTVYGWNRFHKAAEYFDIHFVIRDQNIAELKHLGAQNIYRYHKGFDPDTHRPTPLNDNDKRYEVLFIGHYESKREADIAFLIKHNIPVTVIYHDKKRWKKGPHWYRLKNSFIEADFYGHNYAKALSSAKIALNCYCRANRDKENSRMYEIPACGAFLLTERNDENISIFEEGKQAEFFSSPAELLEKVTCFLNHPGRRNRIAAAGRLRCLKSGYDYDTRLREMLHVVTEYERK